MLHNLPVVVFVKFPGATWRLPSLDEDGGDNISDIDVEKGNVNKKSGSNINSIFYNATKETYNKSRNFWDSRSKSMNRYQRMLTQNKEQLKQKDIDVHNMNIDQMNIKNFNKIDSSWGIFKSSTESKNLSYIKGRFPSMFEVSSNQDKRVHGSSTNPRWRRVSSDGSDKYNIRLTSPLNLWKNINIRYISDYIKLQQIYLMFDAFCKHR